jgi:hypothetical protein
VNADIHSIDVHFIDKLDPYIDPEIGARGVGEITEATHAIVERVGYDGAARQISIRFRPAPFPSEEVSA